MSGVYGSMEVGMDGWTGSGDSSCHPKGPSGKVTVEAGLRQLEVPQ